MDNLDVTRNRTAGQWLAIADDWHWKAVELYCDADVERRQQHAPDIAALSAFADYALRRAQVATPAPETSIDAAN